MTNDQILDDLLTAELTAEDFEGMDIEELVDLYGETNEEMKQLKNRLDLIKGIVNEKVDQGTKIETDDFKLSTRVKKTVKFSEDVTPEEINMALVGHPDVAIEYALKMKNVGAGLASDLVPYFDETKIYTEEKLYTVVSVKKS